MYGYWEDDILDGGQGNDWYEGGKGPGYLCFGGKRGP